MSRAIGIDLGTTNSCVAVVEHGRARVIRQEGGGSTLPSIVAADPSGRVLVGEAARRIAALHPERTIVASKRLLGRRLRGPSRVLAERAFAYEVLAGPDETPQVRMGEELWSLEQVGAALLRKLRDRASIELGEPVTEAVLTVPAYFNERQRHAVREAGRLAGLDVLRVLNEPTAAALAYAHGRDLHERLVVYDLGGGTFDVSVIDVAGNLIEVRATGGDTFLGGVDVDDRVLAWALARFQTAEGVDVSNNRPAVQRLRDACEAAKIALSTSTRARLQVPFLATRDDAPVDLDLALTRGQLEALCDDLVDRTLDITQRMVAEAGDRPVDTILLVGGQSRMPLIRSRITTTLGRAPAQGVHPDEAVALGAALLAAALTAQPGPTGQTAQPAPSTVPSGHGARDEGDPGASEGRGAIAAPAPDLQPAPDFPTLIDVLPMAVGTAAADGRLQAIFPRGSPLPSQARRILTTSTDDQETLVVGILQGESERAADNEFLGGFVFSGVPRGVRGSVCIEARFRIDAEGVLAVSGVEVGSGRPVACARVPGTPSIPSVPAGAPPALSPSGTPAEGAPRSFEGAPPRIEARVASAPPGGTAWDRVKGWFGGGTEA